MTQPSKIGSRINKLASKPHQSAAGLLGRTGSGGLGQIKLPAKLPQATEESHAKKAGQPGFVDASQPVASAKHTGKPEARRPTGRAVSGS